MALSQECKARARVTHQEMSFHYNLILVSATTTVRVSLVFVCDLFRCCSMLVGAFFHYW
jgi:hypothetical protein